MATITLWKGTRRIVLGDEYAFVENVEFDGEQIGGCWEEYDARGVHTVFYRTADGRAVVHVVRWSRWENEATYAEVYIYPTLEDASASFRWEMEQAGVISRPTLSLDEIAEP